MTAEQMLAKLLTKLSAPALPVSIDLWDVAHVGAYLKRSSDFVRGEIVCLPTFPKPIRIGSGRPQALYPAREVIKWAESQRS